MMTLTAASRLATFLRWQLSCVHGTILTCHTTTNHPNIPHDRFRISASWSAAHRVGASPLTSRLAVLLWPNRVHFRCRLSGSIGCSPPRLAATQLLQVLTQNTVPSGRGLPPRRIVTLHSALVRTVLCAAWGSRARFFTGRTHGWRCALAFLDAGCVAERRTGDCADHFIASRGLFARMLVHSGSR